MNRTKTKLIKNIISYEKEDKMLKKLFRRLKKAYSQGNQEEKKNFINNLKIKFNYGK